MISVFQVPIRISLFLLGLLSVWTSAVVQANSPTDQVAFYIRTYGQVPITNPRVARANKVFEQVLAVADKNNKHTPELVVINYPKGPWAIALPDGHIVLSKQAVNLCYQRTRSVEIDACLAFVLGHELAHLAHDDFWHRQLYQFRGQKPSATETRHNREVAERELKADDKGFIYAALSGFAVDTLLVNKPGKADFFTLWIQEEGGYPDSSSTHPSTSIRLKLLHQRLAHLQKKISFFNFGVRLSHFDYCDDAIPFFQAFRAIYPGREVLNNLGFCHLQMARQTMLPEQAYFYWMPSVLDGETRAVSYKQRSGLTLQSLKQPLNQQVVESLNKAQSHFKQAIEADPGYLPAHLNLATTLLYLGRPHGALDILTDITVSMPDNPDIQNLDILALYESRVDTDAWHEAVGQLKKRVQKSDASPRLIFNLARLLDTRASLEEARVYWSRLGVIIHQLPDAIQAIVCQKQSTVSMAVCGKSIPLTGAAVDTLAWPWPLPDKKGRSLSASEQVQLNRLDSIKFDGLSEPLKGSIYQYPQGIAEILVMDRFVQMQVLMRPKGMTNIKLQTYCDKPLRQRQLARGTVQSCGHWAALTRNDEVQEVWLMVK